MLACEIRDELLEANHDDLEAVSVLVIKAPFAGRRPIMTAFRKRAETLDQWATRILLHAHAIVPCPDHGYMRLRFSHQGLVYAHALAEHDPFPKKSKLKCVEAVNVCSIVFQTIVLAAINARHPLTNEPQRKTPLRLRGLLVLGQ